MSKPNLAQQLRSNLKKRKLQKNRRQSKIRIIGGAALQGEIAIAGAKNAALPMMIASLLTHAPVRLTNIPNLTDIHILTELLQALGTEIDYDPKTKSMVLASDDLHTSLAPPALVKQIRASFWVIAPLLARIGAAEVAFPGGDAIGTRSVDIYLKGLKSLGATIEEMPHAVHLKTRGLKGTKFALPFPSVGATHVLMMAACCAKGETRLENTAREPEIVALANLLNQMGAQIEDAGQSVIHIQGVDQLFAAECAITPDRIEAGTYAIASAAVGGRCIIQNAPIAHMEALLDCLRAAEIHTEIGAECLTVSRAPDQPIKPVNITTQPYPGFPTDLQAQWMVLMTQANGSCTLTETLFENRFRHVAELAKLGADIHLDGQTATIQGAAALTGSTLIATDIRASASLIIAGLLAEGETIIDNIHHLDRGFETIELKLNQCGAHIERLNQ